MTIEEAGAQLRARKVCCAELVGEALKRAEELNPKLNAFITLTAEAALSRAEMLDQELARGQDRGPLHGIPIAHKDLLFTKGVRTTCGSKLFENFVPDHDADVIRKLDEAGAVSIGKLGLHELAYGVTSSNPHFGPVRNPHNTDCIPGGSSGGSGAAVAAGIVFMATGTDTGGSIRIPAAYCGTVGFKPTYGLVSTRGVQPLGLTLDHIGPLTRTVRDAELALGAMASLRPATQGKVRIGIPSNFYFDQVDAEVAEAVQKAARLLGSQVETVAVPDIEALNTVGRVILLAEASAVYDNKLSNPEQFGPDVLALLQQGSLIAGTEYVNAQRLRRRLIQDFQKLFERIDILLTPTLPIVAPQIGQKTVEIEGVSYDTRLATTRFVRGTNVLGWPALSVPCGLSASGLPIGVQLIGRPFEDALVLKAGSEVEQLLHDSGVSSSIRS